MTPDTLLRSNPAPTTSLEDIVIRQRQLEAHLLHSPDYLQRANREIKLQVSILYLAIAVLIVFQGLFAWNAAGNVSLSGTILTSLTALLAILNCLLLIRTKACLRRLNEAWLRPGEKRAVQALRERHRELLLTSQKSGRAELN